MLGKRDDLAPQDRARPRLQEPLSLRNVQKLQHADGGPRVDNELRGMLIRDAVWDRDNVVLLDCDVFLKCKCEDWLE